jgi:hypothetical protein
MDLRTIMNDRVKLIGDGISEAVVLELTDALGDAIDGMEEELKKRWWWKILWPVLLYGPLILAGIYLYQM